jgi:hypothetical protein
LQRQQDKKKPQPQSRPREVELIGKTQRRFSLRFDLPATYSEAASLLFLDGKVPEGLAIAPSGGAGYSDRWNLMWSGDITAAAPHFSLALARVLGDVVLTSTLALTPEETAAHKRELEKALKYRLDFLGMTVGEAFDRLEPGGHEINGYFVFVGRDPNFPRGTVLEWVRVSKNNETFNGDMRFYLLEQGLSLDQSIWAFTKQWQEIAIKILLEYVNVLAGAAGTGGRAPPAGTEGGVRGARAFEREGQTAAVPKRLRLPQSLGAAANIEVISKIKNSSFAVREAKALSQAAQKDVDSLIAQLIKGNANPGMGTRALSNGFYELRGRHAGRVIIKELSHGKFDIVGKFQAHVRGDTENSALIERLIQDYRR